MDLDSERGREAIEALRERQGFSDGRRDALLERLQRSIAAGDAARLTADIDADDAQQARDDLTDERRRRRGWMFVAAAAIALLGWSAWNSFSKDLATEAERERTEAVDHADRSDPQGEVVPQDVSAVRQLPPQPPVEQIAEPEPQSEPKSEPIEPRRPRKPKATKRRNKPTRPPPPQPTPDDLEGELALLRQARAASRRGEARAALSYLEQHRREYASGQLKLERDALRVELLCRIDPKRGQRARASFLRGRMSKSLRTRVEAVRCEGDE